MSIIFKPTGSLDIDTDPSELPQSIEGTDIVSGAFKRCKNLRLDEKGVLKVRDGSYQINATALIGTMDFRIEQGGYRYVFGGEYIYKNEVLISEGIQVAAPTFDPVAGLYSSEQSVTIATTTAGATIYYTIDGTTPSQQSLKYINPITIPFFTTLKAIAVRTGFLDSDITEGYYSPLVLDFVTESDADNLVSETNGDDFIGEGTS